MVRALLCLNSWNTWNQAALWFIDRLLLIKVRISTDEHRWNLPLNVLRPRDVARSHHILRKMMIDLSLHNMKLIHSVLWIVPRICSVDRVLNAVSNGNLVWRNVLLLSSSHYILDMHSTSKILVWDIALYWSHKIWSVLHTIELTCIVICLLTVCICRSRKYSLVFLRQHLGGFLQ